MLPTVGCSQTSLSYSAPTAYIQPLASRYAFPARFFSPRAELNCILLSSRAIASGSQYCQLHRWRLIPTLTHGCSARGPAPKHLTMTVCIIFPILRPCATMSQVLLALIVLPSPVRCDGMFSGMVYARPKRPRHAARACRTTISPAFCDTLSYTLQLFEPKKVQGEPVSDPARRFLVTTAVTSMSRPALSRHRRSPASESLGSRKLFQLSLLDATRTRCTLDHDAGKRAQTRLDPSTEIPPKNY